MTVLGGCVIKRKLKFENYKNCLEASYPDIKIYYLEENKINVDSLKKDRKEFMKKDKLILQTQQRFKSERHNAFTEEVNKIALSSNDDKKMQLIDATETCTWSKQICSKYQVRKRKD